MTTGRATSVFLHNNWPADSLGLFIPLTMRSNV